MNELREANQRGGQMNSVIPDREREEVMNVCQAVNARERAAGDYAVSERHFGSLITRAPDGIRMEIREWVDGQWISRIA